MGKFISITVGILLAPLLLYFLYSSTLLVLGYELNHSPEDLAEKLVQENRPAKDCFLFRTLDLGPRPSTQEMQMRCVRVYAELKKDPMACELLMPSSYGLSCVGGAEESESCKMRSGYVASDDGSIPYKDCKLNDPSRTKLQNDCCLIARVTFVQSENNCLSLQNDKDLYEECISNMSFKKHDPTACAIIENKNRLAACIVRAAAILKNPSICDGCKKPVENLSDLQ